MKRYRIWLLAVILLAFGLRLHNLTYHSLWFDEAMSLHWARQSVPRILEVGFSLVEDRLPPLYYLLLKGWTGLFGFSEFGVRSLSVFSGTLLLPLLVGVARRLFNRRIGLLAAGLVALNPFLVWYAQEARMYAQAGLFGVLAVWAFLGMIQGTKRTWLFAPIFILAAIAGLYSHLYTGFLLPALGLWLLFSYPRAGKLWLGLALVALLIGLAFLPQALAIWRFSGEAVPGQPLSGVLARAWGLLTAFTLWKAPLAPAWRLTIPVAITLLTLAAFLKQPEKQLAIDNYQLPIANYQLSTGHYPAPLLLTTLLLAMPFIIATILLVRNYLAFFGERYFIVMVPWLLLLAAVGAEQAGRWLSRFGRSGLIAALPAILLLAATAGPLPGQWSGAAAKEFWRQSVAYLAGRAGPEDAILIHPDWVRYPFQFYFTGPGQTYAAFSKVEAGTVLDGPLQGVVADHAVVWLIQSHLDGPDPDRRVEQWFAGRYPLVTELYPPGLSLKGYAPAYRLAQLPVAATPLDLHFENGLRLVGFQTEPLVSARDEFFHPPSGWLHVTLYWMAYRPITAAARPYLHLVGPAGVWGASLERTNDTFGLYPPQRWTSATEVIRHDLDVNLNPATPPGFYDLVLGFPDQEWQYRLTEVEVR